MFADNTVFFLVALAVLALAVGVLAVLLYLTYSQGQQREQHHLETRALLEKWAYEDDVTGLWTLGKFSMEAQPLLADAQPGDYALVVFDLDNFAYVNNGLGYKEGNRLLRCLGRYLTGKSVPRALCGHIQADRFVLLCRSQYLDALVESLNVRWLTTDFPEVNDLLGRDYSLSFSIGIYPVSDPTCDLNTMIGYANAARGQGKLAFGTTVVTYSEELDLEMQLHGKMTLLMEHGLSDQEFTPYLQPQYALADGQLVGAEVLTRWNSPTMGMVFPTEFVPAFEQNGFILKLDYYIFERSCAMLRSWLGSSIARPPRLTVNFSKLTVVSDGFVERLVGLAARYSIPHDLLYIDITDSRVSFDTTKFSSRLLALSHAGFAYEAKGLNDAAVYIGVETQEQVDSLRDTDHNVVQGFYFSRPMPQLEFECNILANMQK